MKLNEISELKPLIWTLLEKLVGDEGEVYIDSSVYRRGDASNKGCIYSTEPVVSSHNNIPCSIEDAALLLIRYMADSESGFALRSFYLDTEADNNYTIKKINGNLTLVNV